METTVETSVIVAQATVSGRDLSKAVQTVKKLVSKRSTLPVLENVLVSVAGGEISVTGTDLESFARVVIPCASPVGFAVTVKPEPLIAVAKAGIVTLTLIDDETLKVNGMTLKGIVAADFPPFPELPDNMTLVADLKDAIDHVAFAASKDEAWPVLQAIQFTPGTAAATDGYRIGVYPVSYHGDPLLIPAAGLAKFANLFGDDTRIGYNLQKNKVWIDSGTMTYVSELITGDYPNWKPQILKDYKCLCSFDSDTMTSAIQTVAMIAKQTNGVIRFVQDGETVSLSATCEEAGEASANVPVAGAIEKIAFNYRYVLDFLKSIEGRVTFKMNAYNRGAQFECGSATCVIMPMHLG